MENSQKDYSTAQQEMQVPFKIDPEFKNKIPSMPKEDFDGLRNDIVSDGYVRDPLVVWKEENTLVDGHHRWQIIQDNYELLKDKYKVVYKSFPDRWAAIAWICANQLHKHNMNETQRLDLIRSEYEAKKKSERFRGNQYTNDGSDEIHRKHKGKNATRKSVAEEHGITEWEVQKAVEFGRGLDSADAVIPGFKNKVLSGEVVANNRDIASMRYMNQEEIKETVADICSGKKSPRAKRPPKTEEEKRDIAEIESIINDMRDPTTTPEYTIDFLLEDIELNGQTYVDLLANTMKDHSNLATDENKPLIMAAIDKVVENIKKVRDSL